MKVNRRDFLVGTAAATAAAALPITAQSGEDSPTGKRKPNIVIYHSDQFRWRNSSAPTVSTARHARPISTPWLQSGTNFSRAVTNQPVCAPSRSVLLTGRYATETGVWRNGLGLRQDLPTIATEFRKAGYTANYIGKWHLAPGQAAEGGGRGPVKVEHRGGFLDLWEASNALEFSTHPYEEPSGIATGTRSPSKTSTASTFSPTAQRSSCAPNRRNHSCSSSPSSAPPAERPQSHGWSQGLG